MEEIQQEQKGNFMLHLVCAFMSDALFDVFKAQSFICWLSHFFSVSVPPGLEAVGMILTS